ncbi:MAG: hypothetical protein D3922_15210 [Candidatus Electrothrix sp. AR1]|nr:hypothetical protein [Candidatus Electrothrix sp. AR1]
MNDKGKVKVNFTIENLPKIYTETGQTWEDESFSYDLQISEEGGAGKLEINKADVLPDEIEGVIELIEKKPIRCSWSTNSKHLVFIQISKKNGKNIV